ncbi:ISL3 family transposase [Methylobacterium sp. NEAU 140]|nr:ISL3 family transposase [Methylobacterium sp. NEAU 140]MDP4026103.1 ISL3 family transposase [Methylobacterium sp. NEAU 140]
MVISNPSLPSVPDGVHVDALALEVGTLTITARTTAPRAVCPQCGQGSARVHSAYWRSLKDLPWQDRSVTWRVKVRRFRCGRCPGRIFAEPVPGLARAKAQRSDRLAAAQTDIGMALGGEAGARLSRRLAMPVSGDTVLRLVRRRGIGSSPPPRVVGIDDWAWRRGRHYGTIVCDLERGRVLDLLPGRSCAPVRAWLAAHPDIAVVSRDRAGPYAEAARLGAPQAIQVADRWHLLVNASEALRGVVERHQPEIREAARRVASQSPEPIVAAADPTDPPPEEDAGQGGGRRRQRCEAALRLHGEGFSIKAIARTLGASRNGVRRWLRVGAFVPYRRAPAPTQLDPHLPFVEARWRDGQHNAAALHRELRAVGFAGGYEIVQRWAKRRRSGTGHDRPVRPPSARIPSTRRIARWLTCDPAKLSVDDLRFVEVLCDLAPRLQAAAEQVRGFGTILRAGDPAALKPWLDAAAASELGGFVAGLQQDEAAVQAAIAEPWSNGPVEGQVNRLKLIKRSMYGRAGFDLLRQRVLHAA